MGTVILLNRMKSSIISNNRGFVLQLQSILKVKGVAKIVPLDENMIIKYIDISGEKRRNLEKLLREYIGRSFKDEKGLLFNNNELTLSRNRRYILLYCIKSNSVMIRISQEYWKVNVCPIQELITKNINNRYPKEKLILVFFRIEAGLVLFVIIYKGILLYTSTYKDFKDDLIQSYIYEGRDTINGFFNIKLQNYILLFVNDIGKEYEPIKSGREYVRGVKRIRIKQENIL